MSVLNKVKRFFYNPYVAVMRNPYTTAYWAGLLGSTALYVTGLLYFATPQVLSFFVTAGMVTTFGLTIGAAFIAAVALTALCASTTDDFVVSELIIASVGSGCGYLIASAAKLLWPALTAANPLAPLIVLGTVLPQVGAFISMGLTKMIKSIFDIHALDYDYIEDDEPGMINRVDRDIRVFYRQEFNIKNDLGNTHDLIKDLLPPLPIVKVNNLNDAYQKLNEDEPNPAPVYHEGINIIPGQPLDAIKQENQDDYPNEDEQALFVPKLA